MQPVKSKQFSKKIFPYLLLCASLTISGCAHKPWGSSFEEKEYDAGLQLVEELTAQGAKCNKGFQSDLTVEYSTPLGKRTFAGFLQYSSGPNYKFVASNPLGQPLIIIAGNQKSYQVINTLESIYSSGGMTAFALRNKLPIYFLKGRWDDWITGRNSIATEYVSDISPDKEQRGMWVTLPDNRGAGNISHILIDTEKRLIIERIIETRKEKPLATIVYSDFYQEEACTQPQNIAISGLDYGTFINLKFSDVELSSDLKKFHLKPPKGYLQRYRP
ncbi:hypothetical protein [Desulforhopalus sp. 52FAK]